MQVPLQITIRNFKHSTALEDRIRGKVEKLEELYPRITSCRVTVEEMRLQHRQGREFEVRIDVRIPQHEIVASRDHHEDVYVALRDAFDSAKRQLEDIAREQRGQVKAHEVTQHGKVARIFIDDGVGFIESSDGRELYFSRENVTHPRFEQLAPGMEVQFIEELADNGPQAKRITVGKHHF